MFAFSLLVVTLMNGYLLGYSGWMCAHPLYQDTYWQTRLYVHLTIGTLCLLAWGYLLFQVLRNRTMRHRRQNESVVIRCSI